MITYTDQENNEQKAKCPNCLQSPPGGPNWVCFDLEKVGCGFRFDTFQTRATCPNCGRKFLSTQCPNCHNWASFSKWFQF